MDMDYIYHVTGVDVHGKRFNTMVFSNYIHAMSINLYRGSVWSVHKATGKRTLIKRVFN